MQSQIHPALQVAEGVSVQSNRVVEWKVAVKTLGRRRWEAHDTSENLRQVGGARRSAGALEPKLLDGGLEGGGLQTEQRSGAGRAVDAPAGLGARPPIFRSVSEGSCVFNLSIPWIFTAKSNQLLNTSEPRVHRALEA